MREKIMCTTVKYKTVQTKTGSQKKNPFFILQYQNVIIIKPFLTNIADGLQKYPYYIVCVRL